MTHRNFDYDLLFESSVVKLYTYQMIDIDEI
jgi:hypothetical protein